jgi:uncharacterized protein YjbI with pentapeptide repeats
MIAESLKLQIWERLIEGKPLDGFALATKNGRIDLAGLDLPERSIERGVLVTKIGAGTVLHDVKWRNFDFSGSKLNGLRLFGCELSNCCFDGCQLRDSRLWSTTVTQCSFKGANLKKSVLGGVENGKRNLFLEVDFSDADLRETVYKAAAFERCIFRGTKLVKIDFQTSTFTDCVFEGDLHDVLFYRRGFQGEAFPPNEMINVDFSRAKLHDVSFRGLTLDKVKLPQDAAHIVIKDFPATVDKLIATLKQQGDTTAKKLVDFLNVDRRWIAPDQAQGVINAEDLAETVGLDGLTRLRELLRQ